MRIAVVGAGGVGGYFGGRLATAGHEVTFLARGEHLRALRDQGLKVESIEGDFHLQPTRATDRPAEVGPVDAVLVAVKAWQVPEVARDIGPLLGPETIILPLQNGVEAADQLAEVLGAEHVLGGLAKIISRIVAPGRIEHSGATPYIALGELDGGPSARVHRLREALADAGITVDVPDDINAAIWEKFLFIAAVSGLGAVTRATLGVLRALPETLALLEQAMREVAAVAAALDIRLDKEVVPRTMAFIDDLPAQATASMQRDILAGRPSELESQNGAAVRLGRQAGVPTPLHLFLYSCLLPMERAARAAAATGTKTPQPDEAAE